MANITREYELIIELQAMTILLQEEVLPRNVILPLSSMEDQTVCTEQAK